MAVVAMVVALIGQTHIDTGLFGLIGFPIIAGVYADKIKVGKVDTDSNREISMNQVGQAGM